MLGTYNTAVHRFELKPLVVRQRDAIVEAFGDGVPTGDRQHDVKQQRMD